MSNQREEILNKIRALRAKASDAAATEAEAAGAAMVAAKLLQKHDVKETELEISEAGAVSGVAKSKKEFPAVLNACWEGIERLTETKVYRDGGLNFIGTPHDVEMGVYLAEMITGAAKRAWLNSPEAAVKRKFKDAMLARSSFMYGFGLGLNTRMMNMSIERAEARMTQHGTTKGGALVVCKEQLIVDKMAEMGLELEYGPRDNRQYADMNALNAGREQSKNVNLNRPVEGADNGWGELA